MGTANDWKELITSMKDTGRVNYHNRRRAIRSDEYLSRTDREHVRTRYAFQYVVDCNQDRFLLPLSSVYLANWHNVGLTVINYHVEHKVTGKTPQDVLYKGMIYGDVSDTENMIAVQFNENEWYYATRDFILDNQGNPILSIFGECSRHDDIIRLDRVLVKLSSDVYQNPANAINKAIIKYVLPYIFEDIEDCNCAMDCPAILKTAMLVEESTPIMTHIEEPSINTFSNDSVIELLQNNSHLFT